MGPPDVQANIEVCEAPPPYYDDNISMTISEIL